MYHSKMNLLYDLLFDCFTKGFEYTFEKAGHIQSDDPFMAYLGEMDMLDVISVLQQVFKDNFYDFSFKVRSQKEGK